MKTKKYFQVLGENKGGSSSQATAGSWDCKIIKRETTLPILLD